MSHKEVKRWFTYSEYSKTFSYQDDLFRAELRHIWHFIKHNFE